MLAACCFLRLSSLLQAGLASGLHGKRGIVLGLSGASAVAAASSAASWTCSAPTELPDQCTPLLVRFRSNWALVAGKYIMDYSQDPLNPGLTIQVSRCTHHLCLVQRRSSRSAAAAWVHVCGGGLSGG